MKRRSILGSQKAQQKKDKRNQVILGFFVIVLMVTSVLGVALYNTGGAQAGTYSDQGQSFEIINQGGQQLLQADINGETYQFYYTPSDTLTVPSDYNPLFTQGQVVGLGFNPQDENLEFIDLARYILALDLDAQGTGVVTYVTSEDPNFQFPVVDCANNEVPALIFQYDNTTQITQDGQCLFIQGFDPAEILRATDRLRYQMLGVI